MAEPKVGGKLREEGELVKRGGGEREGHQKPKAVPEERREVRDVVALGAKQVAQRHVRGKEASDKGAAS